MASTSYEQGQAGQPRPLQMGAKGAYIVRLLMVGDSSCGKTSLVLRFDQNVFSTKFVTTIGVDYRDKMVKVRTNMRISMVVFDFYDANIKFLCTLH
jgi:GTPase SAR1 family protein